MKKVSIISPCYNGEKYLNRYLESVLNQTYPIIELIFVDDCSTDSTPQIVEEYIQKFKNKGYDLVYIKQDVNKGQAAAINRGLEIFSGEYMMWMDSDDIYILNAIEMKVAFLEQNQNMDFVLNMGEVVFESDVNRPVSLLQRKKPEGKDDLFKDLIDAHNVVFTPGSIFVRSEAIRRAIPSLKIYESREGQNWQMMLPLAYCCDYGYINEALFKYVIHNDSHSHLKRSYEEEIKRRENFYVLKTETVKNIPGMTKEEVDYWNRYIYENELYNKYKIALRFCKITDSSMYKKELKKMNYKFGLIDNVCVYYVAKSLKMIKSKVWNMLRKNNI